MKNIMENDLKRSMEFMRMKIEKNDERCGEYQAELVRLEKLYEEIEWYTREY